MRINWDRDKFTVTKRLKYMSLLARMKLENSDYVIISIYSHRDPTTIELKSKRKSHQVKK